MVRSQLRYKPITQLPEYYSAFSRKSQAQRIQLYGTGEMLAVVSLVLGYGIGSFWVWAALPMDKGPSNSAAAASFLMSARAFRAG